MNLQYIIESINKDKEAKYFEDETGLIVIGNVDISDRRLEEIPVRFSVVTGSFNCSHNQLVSLNNCPRVIGKDFICDGNIHLKSLEGHPSAVGGLFSCKHNSLPTDLQELIADSLENKINWKTICNRINISVSKKLTDLNSKLPGLFDFD